MKKIIIKVAVLCTFALSFVLTSCEKKSSATDSAVTITVWCWDQTFNIYAMNEAAKIYNRDNPNVTINVVETPWDDLQQKLVTSLSANQANTLPDIILMQDNALQKNLTNYPNAFLPVNGKIDLSQFAQYKLGYGEVDGKNYSVPFDNGVTCTFLRRDILESAGLRVEDFNNITWDRFYELGKIVKEKTGVAMISYFGNETDIIMIMLQSAGTWLFDSDGKPLLANNDVLKKALDIYAKMIQDGVCLIVPDWNAYIATINNGTTASAINGCWLVGSISAAKDQSGKWAVVNTPKLSNVATATNYSSNGGSSWMVMANSKNPDTAMDFLNKTFAGSIEFYNTILPSSGAIATWEPAAQAEAYNQPNEFFGGQKIYIDIVEYAKHVPQVKYGIFNYEARNAVGMKINDIVNGTSTIDAALAEAQKNIEFMMGY